MKAILLSTIVLLSAGLAVCRAEDTNKVEPTKEASESEVEKKPASTNDVAVITTSEGVMVIEFWPDVATNTVENFKKLAKKGFYDGTCFHRVVKGFMIQGGDPKTKDARLEGQWGQGDPGYKIKAEFNSRPHVRGVISMARNQSPDSAGCQFFICLADRPDLNGKYTTFGKLIKGDDTLEKIGNVECIFKPGPDNQPSRPAKRVNVDNIKIVPADSVK